MILTEAYGLSGLFAFGAFLTRVRELYAVEMVIIPCTVACGYLEKIVD